jgi:hypothetical protein
VGTLSPIDHSSGGIIQLFIIDAVLYTKRTGDCVSVIWGCGLQLRHLPASITLGNVTVPEDALLIYIINIYTARD